MVAHTCNHSPRMVEAGTLGDQGCLQQHNEFEAAWHTLDSVSKHHQQQQNINSEGL